MSQHKRYTEEHLLKALREAASILGEPLGRGAYNKAAPIHRWPASATIVKPFGTWQKACHKAGVKVKSSRIPYRGTYTIDTCVGSIVVYMRAHDNKTPTYEQYSRWAALQGYPPSGATIRARIGWTKALELCKEKKTT